MKKVDTANFINTEHNIRLEDVVFKRERANTWLKDNEELPM